MYFNFWTARTFRITVFYVINPKEISEIYIVIQLFIWQRRRYNCSDGNREDTVVQMATEKMQLFRWQRRRYSCSYGNREDTYVQMATEKIHMLRWQQRRYICSDGNREDIAVQMATENI